MNPLYVLHDGALKYEHFSAVEGVPDGSNLDFWLKLRVHLRLNLSCT